MSKAAVVAITIVVLLVVGGAAVVARGAPPSWDTANGVVDRWLASMHERSGDRGWSWLSTETQNLVYGNDPNEYWSDLDAVDWSEVAWAPANGYVDDGAYYSGYIWLRSHPSTLPRFIIERGLAAADCIEGAPAGIRAQMTLGWFNPPRISALIGKADAADPCAIAFEEEPGTPHEPFDVVGGAWASPGSIQRVGVLDSSGLVTAVSWGRENPPLDGAVSVTTFEPGDLAVTWRGASCDSNTTLLVEGAPSALEITVQRGLDDGCSGTDVIYDSILELRSAVQPENIEVDLVGPAGTAAPPVATEIPIGGARGPMPRQDLAAAREGMAGGLVEPRWLPDGFELVFLGYLGPLEQSTDLFYEDRERYLHIWQAHRGADELGNTDPVAKGEPISIDGDHRVACEPPGRRTDRTGRRRGIQCPLARRADDQRRQ